MKPCRECQHEVSEQAPLCPNCGAPYPAKAAWDGWGYEYKSKAAIGSLPLLHISFKYKPNRFPKPARGIIAIGQFAAGIVAIGQVGVGVVSISQAAIAVWAVGQFAAAFNLIAQMGVYVVAGRGQAVISVAEFVEWLLSKI